MSVTSSVEQRAAAKVMPAARRRFAWYRFALGLLLAPFVLGATLLIVLPALLTVILAFTEYDALSAPLWSGLQNFRTIFQRDVFWIAVRNSLIFVGLSAPLQLLGALTLALLLYQARTGVRQYRIATYLPSVIPDVAYALIWLWLFNPLYGPLNKILVAVGLPPLAWLVDADTALYSLVLMACFRIGEGMLVLIAALQGGARSLFPGRGVGWRQSLATLSPYYLAPGGPLAAAAVDSRCAAERAEHLYAGLYDDGRWPWVCHHPAALFNL